MQDSYDIQKKKLDKILSLQNGDGSNGLSEEDIDELRTKTREVEELGGKIDGIITVRQDTEILIQRLGAYDTDLFDEIQK